MIDRTYRHRVAALARQVRAGEMDFVAFLEAVGPPSDPYKTGDDDVDALINLFELEPTIGKKWMFHTSDSRAHAANLADLDRRIDELAN